MLARGKTGKSVVQLTILILLSLFFQNCEQFASSHTLVGEGSTAASSNATAIFSSLPVGQDFYVTKAYSASGGIETALGGGALVLTGVDQTTKASQGGAYFVYDADPALMSDHGAIALYPVQQNMSSSLSIAPSGPSASMIGEDTASLGLQLDNGLNRESRFVAVMKKWGEMRFATINTGTNSKVIPMTFWVGNNKLLEMTVDGQVNLFFKGDPVMTMDPANGIVSWQKAQVPILYASVSAVQTDAVLDLTPQGTEISFVDNDGITKKALKQSNGHGGRWRRVNDLYLLW